MTEGSTSLLFSSVGSPIEVTSPYTLLIPSLNLLLILPLFPVLDTKLGNISLYSADSIS